MLLNSITKLTNIEIESLLKRQGELQEVMPSVTPILNDIKENGDTALLKYTMQFDKAALKDIEVSHKEIHEAVFSLDKKLLTHLKKAASNIRAFHEAQATKDWIKEFAPGIRLGQRISPLGSVGAYVPGGRA